ncbi:MAG: methionyl-tRNA formyltransferase [Actinomycetota bacterium]|nr:methionyl-tRNA formyltransferase [Actinomycetota bacterium]
MRIVFFGTPAWAVPSLESLERSDAEVVAVVSNPDRPSGRGMQLRPSSVKVAAEALGLEVIQPERARSPELHGRLAELAPDVAVVVAYGSLLPGPLLEVPRCGFVNLHFSLLPEYRGAAPVQRAIMDGRSETGVSLMVLTEGMDEGPVLMTERVPIAPWESAGELGHRLALVGAELLTPALVAYGEGRLVARPQDGALATYASKIDTNQARIDWDWDAGRIDRHARGLDPVPGAWTTFDGKRLKIFRVEIAVSDEGLPPGAIATDEDLLIGTGSAPLRLLEGQLAGKRRMNGQDLARGLHPTPDALFR